jgi:hemoglobin
MKKDIQSKNDIEYLVVQFYEKVKVDHLLGPIFTEIVKVNWDEHLPVMISFWENALFYNGTYSGNPVQTHQYLHNKHPLTQEHFDRWLELFVKTVEKFFEGERADIIKKKAGNISLIMQIKLVSGNKMLKN